MSFCSYLRNCKYRKFGKFESKAELPDVHELCNPPYLDGNAGDQSVRLAYRLTGLFIAEMLDIRMTDPLLDAYSELFEIGTATDYMLAEAFRCINTAAHREIAGVILTGQAYDEEGELTVKKPWRFPVHIKDLRHPLEPGWGEIDPDAEVQVRMLWERALKQAEHDANRLDRSHRVQDWNVIGHVIFLSACLESVLNTTISEMALNNEIDDASARKLERAELSVKLIFLLRDELAEKKISITRITNLVKLRNKAVHFKKESISGIAPSIEELLGIWEQLDAVFAEIVSRTQVTLICKDLRDEVQTFKSKWVKLSSRD